MIVMTSSALRRMSQRSALSMSQMRHTSMPDQTMIERIARALCSEAHIDPDKSVMKSGGSGDGDRQVAWMALRKQARTILAIMRQPTGAMLSANAEAVNGTRRPIDSGSDHFIAEEIWRAMIDAALEDGNEAS
jgi:hypothetical protein